MRLLGRLGALLGLIVLGWLAVRVGAGVDVAYLFSSDREDWKLEYASEATISPAYAATGDRWLEFTVPNPASQLRIVANAVLTDLETARRALERDPQRRWSFALDIELVGRRGESLLSRRHHFRTDFGDWRDAAGRRVTDLYFLTQREVPARSVVLILNLSGLPPAARLRLRPASKDADLSEILTRVYFPETISEARLVHLWPRLNERQKSLLAKGSVYPPELLLESERLNLMRHAWTPAGPLGTRGFDFTLREIYALRDLDGLPIEPPALPPGVPVAAGQRAMLQLPEGERRYRVEFVPAATETPGKAPLELRWYGPTPFERRDLRLAREADQESWRLVLAGGVVEIAAADAGAVRLYAEPEGEDLTPQPLYRRLHVLEPTPPVDYELAHDAPLPTPLKIELRTLRADAAIGSPTPPKVHYAFLDRSGQTLASGELDAPTQPSLYDAPVGEIPGSSLSDPAEYYFSVPPQAHRLRLLRHDAGKSEIVLAGVANRPPRLPRQVSMPEDRYATASEGRIPAWFPLRPLDYERRLIEGRTRLAVVQARPPDERPDLLAGDYQWQEYRPTGAWRSVPLLTPREKEAPAREEAIAASYQPLATGREVAIDLPPAAGVQVVRPHLVWVADRDQPPFQITLSVDGQALPPLAARGRHGQIELSPLATGRHRLRIDAPPGPRFLLSHSRPTAAVLVRRQALVVDGALSFVYQREAQAEPLDEYLTLRLFQPPPAERARLRVEVEGDPPPPFLLRPAWVFGERLAELATAGGTSIVLGGHGGRVDGGQPLVIPFPAGTPAGAYRIRVSAVDPGAPARYLTVSRIAAVAQPVRRVFHEEIIHE